MIYEKGDQYITCGHGGCGISITGPTYESVLLAYKAHVDSYHNFMTGQEWYDRFRVELQADIKTPADWVVRAAKRAAGIE
jgi:hypothetical protein